MVASSGAGTARPTLSHRILEPNPHREVWVRHLHSSGSAGVQPSGCAVGTEEKLGSQPDR